MAHTTGLVQFLHFSPDEASGCIFVGPAPSLVEVLMLKIEAGDPPHIAAFKASMIEGLAQALAVRREVTLWHADGDPSITQIELR